MHIRTAKQINHCHGRTRGLPTGAGVVCSVLCLVGETLCQTAKQVNHAHRMIDLYGHHLSCSNAPLGIPHPSSFCLSLRVQYRSMLDSQTWCQSSPRHVRKLAGLHAQSHVILTLIDVQSTVRLEVQEQKWGGGAVKGAWNRGTSSKCNH